MVVVMLFLATLLVVFAPKIYPFFSTVDEVVRYAVLQTRIIEYSFIFGGIAMLARSSFQAIGRAIPGLILTVIRVIGVALPMAYLLVYILDMGVYGVWLGVIAGNIIAGVLALIWVQRTFRAYVVEQEPGNATPAGFEQELAVE